jgi:predicted esterase
VTAVAEPGAPEPGAPEPVAPVERTLATLTHGTYLLRPPAGGAPARALVVGFHGYGEDARSHLAALERLPGADGWLLCAVQALHPFYTRRGEVVACWMTSHDREQAIADNVRYASAVVAAVRREHPRAAERLAWVGFSQGVAMAYRAAAAAGHPARALIALAGDVPPDLASRELPGFPPVLVGTGRADQWYTPQRMEEDVALLRAKGVEAEGFAFDGGHEWAEPFIRRAGAVLNERLAP